MSFKEGVTIEVVVKKMEALAGLVEGDVWDKKEQLRFSAILQKEPSKNGINEGHVVELEIESARGYILASYDREWKIENVDGKNKELINELVRYLDGMGNRRRVAESFLKRGSI